MFDNRSGAEAQQVLPIYATASINRVATVAPRRRAYKCLRADAGAVRLPGFALKFESAQSSPAPQLWYLDNLGTSFYLHPR
jgi:hypothetical protein